MESASLEGAKRAANKVNGRGFFRFRLRLTPDEYNSLRQAVANPRFTLFRFPMCAGGVCSLIHRNTAIDIAPGIVPLFTAANLAIEKSLGYKRIVSIDYEGSATPAKEILGSFPTYFESALFYSIVYRLSVLFH